MSRWWTDYIGIPFADRGRDRSGCDCWGLVRLVYAERCGIDLPSYLDGYRDIADGEGLARGMAVMLPDWRASDPVEFAVPLIRFHQGRLHVGILVDGRRMLHVERAKLACVEPLAPYRNLLQGLFVPA